MTIEKHPIKYRTERIDELVYSMGDLASFLSMKNARELSLVAYQLNGVGEKFDIVQSLELIKDRLTTIQVRVQNYKSGESA